MTPETRKLQMYPKRRIRDLDVSKINQNLLYSPLRGTLLRYGSINTGYHRKPGPRHNALLAALDLGGTKLKSVDISGIHPTS